MTNIIITKYTDGEKITFDINGRIDTTTSDAFETEIKNIGNAKHLVLDFRNVQYISSAGLRVLLSAQKIMNIQGVMTLVNVNNSIMDIFEITGFSDIFSIEQ